MTEERPTGLAGQASRPGEDGGRSDVLKRSLLELRELRARLATAERGMRDPIAIVGIGCRFPGGASSPAAFFKLLRDGVDATGEIPADRWDLAAHYSPDLDAPGKMYTRRGGFLEMADFSGFDERFFGITQRELRYLDPQQRLFLEVAWEALENAAIAPESLQGSRTGVFLGISSSDFAHLLMATTPPADLCGYVGLGTALSFAAGRLAYFLGLRGPALAVDTACSSSLVSVHLGCQSLRSGECDLALAGGVNLILSPEAHTVLCKARVLSPDGRCKTFASGADGYGRSEGCGVVVLRRLSDAIAAGDRIFAIVRGSAVNQDGPKSGLTVPSAAGQQAVLRDALTAAGVSPSEIDYVEAHGTGTPLGDPLEVRALAEVLCQARPRPLWIGSVKTNLGHLEAGSGIAGLIKTTLALYHRELPRHLHAATPSPHIEWQKLGVRLCQEHQPWPASERALAGVSSFGASGTNAHVILEGPMRPPKESAALPHELVLLSARSEEALRSISGLYAAALEAEPRVPLADLANTANCGRARLPHRLALVIDSVDSLRRELRDFATGKKTSAVSSGHAGPGAPPAIAFLCSGQGTQYVGMGRQLLETQPVFARALHECQEILRPLLPRPLLSVLYPAPDESSPLDETLYTQPALFALQWALLLLWRSWGIEPAALLGHSVGEYVAACAAGVLELSDALRLVSARARLMQALPPGGAMAAVFTDEQTARAAAAAHSGSLSIAAINSPGEVVLSGVASALDEVLAALGQRGIRHRRLAVTHAFHSPLIEPMLADLEQVAAAVRLAPPRVSLISNLTGQPLREEELTPRYFGQQARQAVRFAEGLSTLHRQGIRLFVELGPGTALCGLVRRGAAAGDALCLPSLRPQRDALLQMLDSLGQLAVHGAPVDFAGLYAGSSRRKLTLPTYPFERRPYPLPRPVSATASAAPISTVSAEPATALPLPLVPLESPALLPGARVLTSTLAADALPALRDHRVFDTIVVSGVVHLSLVGEAVQRALAMPPRQVFENVEFLQPLIIAASGSRTAHLVLTPDAQGAAHFALHSRASCDDGSGFTLHTRGRVRALVPDVDVPTEPDARRVDIAAIIARCPDEQSGADFYSRLWREGEHHLGPSYRVINQIHRRDGEALCRLLAPPEEVVRPAGCAIALPWLLSISIGEVYGQALLPAVPEYERLAAAADFSFLGHTVERSRDFSALVHQAAYCHARLIQADAHEVTGDITLLAADGGILAAAEGLRVKRVDHALLRQAVRLAARQRRPAVTPRLSENLATATEQLTHHLCQRAAEVSDSSDISPLDSLRQIGFDSLMVVELREQLRADLQVELPLGDLFGESSLAELAAQLTAALRSPGPGADVAAEHRAPGPA